MTGSRAQAMLLVEPHSLTPTAFPVVGLESGGWLAVEATGLTGIDVQLWEGTSRLTQYPLIPGHEIVGRIAEVADDSIALPIGTRVIVESSIRCGACRRCLNRLHSCSLRRPVNAYGRLPSTEFPALWGGLAEYLYIDPGTRLHPVSDDIPAVVATFAHPLAAGFTWAVELPDLSPGENVLILGPGPRGLSALLAAKSASAGWVGVTGLDHDTDRLELAKRLGADMVANAEAEDVASAVANSLGARPDIVIDVTSDDPDALHMSLDLVRAGGRVVLASNKGTNAVNQLFSDIITVKELRILGAFGSGSAGYHWATSQFDIDPRLDQMVSHEFPLAEADRAIQATAGLLGREELISVAVTF
jgi:threonine dehydrogenase-like Zn-dependent dehydrogenase